MRSVIIPPSPPIRVADEVWIATALLHCEHPEREDFTVNEIIERARRRLYREGDPAHPKRHGKIVPEADAIPTWYRRLLEWYRNEYARPQDTWLQGLKDLAGTGKEIFSGIDADEYVRQLREGWE